MAIKTTPSTNRTNTLETGAVINVHTVQKQHLPFVIVWVLYTTLVVSFVSWWTTSPLTEFGFHGEIRGMLHIVILISSACFMVWMRKDWFVQGIRIGAVVAILGVWLLTMHHMQWLGIVVFGVALGCINVSVLLPFVFILNNTEKLYAVVVSNLLSGLIAVVQEAILQSSHIDSYLALFLITIAFTTIFWLKKDEMPSNNATFDIDRPTFHTRIYLTLLFNTVFVILSKGLGKGILNTMASASNYPLMLWYALGGLVGCVSYFALYALSKRSFIWLGNLTFGSFAMALLSNAFAQQIPVLLLLFALLLGIGNAIGIINLCYIIGIIAKKYNNMRYLRQSVFFIGVCGGIAGIALGNYIYTSNSVQLSMIASLVSAAIMLLFIMLSPMVSQSHYYEDWAIDSEHSDIDNRQLYLFQQYRLSNREIEVCKLLLQGYTMRQISGILSIAYSTVNTYCTSLYRKLDINSRTELLLLFKDYRLKQ